MASALKSLSANWMAAPQVGSGGACLDDAVAAIGMDLCPKIGVAIPVGKDSLSMHCQWQCEGKGYAVTSPVSLVITASAPVVDVNKTLTPKLQKE